MNAKKEYGIEIAFDNIYLILEQNCFKLHSHGIMNGIMGICILFYHISRITKDNKKEQFADQLFDRIFTGLSKSSSADFENGLAGIGWGIEYLVQNKFAEGNTDEILEEIDNRVFKMLNEENINSLELTTGLTGYLSYLIMRLRNTSNPVSICRQINQELLIQTINRISEVTINQFQLVFKELYFDLLWSFPVILYCLSEAKKLNIYNEKIRCIIYQWRPYFEAYIPSLHINRLYLAVAIKQIIVQIPDKQLERQAKILLFATDFEILKTEVDYGIINIRYGWPGVARLLKLATEELPYNWPNYELIGQTYSEITKKNYCKLKNLSMNFQEVDFGQFGLISGPAGVCLTDLLCPGLLSGSNPNII